MSGADVFPYPPQDPDGVHVVIANLGRVAASWTTSAHSLARTAVSAPGTWVGDAADKCATEARNLHVQVGNAGTAMTDSANALTPYEWAIVDARHTIDVLRSQYDTLAATRDSQTASALAMDPTTSTPGDRAIAAESAEQQFEIGFSRLHAQYQQALDDVTRAATTASGLLTSVAQRLGPVGLTLDNTTIAKHGMLANLSVLDAEMAKAAADAAAARITQGTYSGQLADDMAQYDEWRDDPNFATEFLTKVGPAELARIPYFLGMSLGSVTNPMSPAYDATAAAALRAKYGHLLDFLGHTLAAGTHMSGTGPHVDGAWVTQLLDAGKAISAGSVHGYYGITQILEHGGNYDPTFLDTVAKDLIAFDKAGGKGMWDIDRAGMSGMIDWNPGGGSHGDDPLVALSLALAQNRQSGQDVFDAATIEQLVNNHSWGDDGAAFGRALETATDGGDPTRDAEIAAMLVHAVGRDGGTLPKGMAGSLATVLARDPRALMLALTTQTPGGTWTALVPGLTPGSEVPTAVYSDIDLAAALHKALGDTTAYNTLVDSLTAYGRAQIEAAARVSPTALRSAAGQVAESFGALSEMRSLALGDDGKAKDAANERFVELLKSGADLIPIPGIDKLPDFSKDVIGAIRSQMTDGAASNLDTHYFDDSVKAAAGDQRAATQLVKDMTTAAMVSNHLYDAGHSPQQWLSHQGPDIQAHPFVHADGSLLTPQEFAADQQAMTNYNEWATLEDGGRDTVQATTQTTDTMFGTGSGQADQAVHAR